MPAGHFGTGCRYFDGSPVGGAYNSCKYPIARAKQPTTKHREAKYGAAKLLGMDDDTESAINALAQKFGDGFALTAEVKATIARHKPVY